MADTLEKILKSAVLAQKAKQNIRKAIYPTNIVVDLNGPDGNVYAVIGICNEAAQKLQLDNDEPIFSLRETFTNRTQAQRRAKGKLEEIKRGQRILTAEMVGNPLISAESLIEITKIREELSGTWVIMCRGHRCCRGRKK